MTVKFVALSIGLALLTSVAVMPASARTTKAHHHATHHHHTAKSASKSSK